VDLDLPPSTLGKKSWPRYGASANESMVKPMNPAISLALLRRQSRSKPL